MIIVVDFGSQYTELLVKKIRESEVFSEIIEWDSKKLLIEVSKYEGIIISGSPDSAKDERHEEIFKQLINLKKPMLCICYGMQVIHKIMGGEVDYGNHPEFGETKLKIVLDHPIVDGIPPIFKVWMSHNDSVIQLANDFKAVAKTNNSYSIAINDAKKIYTLQFHPEIESEYGARIIKNFLFLICKIQKNWKIEDVAKSKIKKIKSEVAGKQVFLALSGGVDSSVVALLLKKAHANINLIFVDNGLICKLKSRLILDYFKAEFKSNLKIINAEEIFFEKLKNIVDPEQKRKIIGELFLEIFQQELDKSDHKLLAQGTIHSDLIESGKKNKSKTIKTHHNTITNLREKINLIEPISDLFKHEVRELGKKLGLPPFIINSQPFPGPGYAIRVIGEVTKEKVNLIKKVDSILQRNLIKYQNYPEVTQSFAVLLNTKAVGVCGDERKYGYVVAIRAIKSKNFMTASVSNLPIQFLTAISNEITNTIPEITKVVYDLSSKPPSTIEWE